MRAQILSCLLVPFFAASLFAQNASRDTFGESLMRYGQPHEEVKKTLPNDGDIIKIKTDLVSSDVLAVSPKGNPLIGLKKDDFVVSENGVPQEISVFSPAQDPKIGRSIILVFGYGVMIEPYIHSSVEAAKVLIDKLGPHDKMAIVNDQIELLSGFTTDKTALTNSLTAFEQIFWKRKNDHIEGARNGKPYISCGQHVDDQYSSLLAALNELVTKDDVRPVVIFQTNGDELPYLKPESKEWKELDKKYAFFRKQCPDSKEWDERPFSIDDIKDAVALSGAIVYSVIPGPRVLGLSEKKIGIPDSALWKC